MAASTLMLRRVGKGVCEEIGATHGFARLCPRGPVLDALTAWAKSLRRFVSWGRLIPGDFAHPTAEALLP
jgi:hypothetical protein